MEYELVCGKCGYKFVPSMSQKEQIGQIERRGGKIAIIKCPMCKKSFTHSLAGQTTQSLISEPFLCPVDHCAGWVSFVNDIKDAPSFYGCGECGQVWPDKASLDHDISKSITKWPYRRVAYMQTNNGGWLPVRYVDLPKNLMKLIENEPFPDN